MERAGRLIGKMKLPQELSDPETRACAAWAVAAGKKVLRHTRATRLVRDSLVVEVEDYIWQKQLATLERFFIANLAEALGEKLVKNIDFRPMPRRLPPQSAGTARPATVETVADPVLDLLYRQSKKRQSA